MRPCNVQWPVKTNTTCPHQLSRVYIAYYMNLMTKWVTVYYAAIPTFIRAIVVYLTQFILISFIFYVCVLMGLWIKPWSYFSYPKLQVRFSLSWLEVHTMLLLRYYTNIMEQKQMRGQLEWYYMFCSLAMLLLFSIVIFSNSWQLYVSVANQHNLF